MGYRAALYVTDPVTRQTQCINSTPHIYCNQCGTTIEVSRGHVPFRWFLNGGKPPGWSLNGDKHYCGRCK